MPTARRAPAATLVRRGGERILVDCGEGTQRQLLRSDLGLVDIEEVFLTHFHADHFLGLPGMLKTFALRGREVPITIHGPAGLTDLFGSLRRIFGRLTYEVGLVELAAGASLPRDGYRIEKAAAGWTRTECAVIATQNSTCRFSTAEEQAATLKARLAGSEASACDVVQARYIGASAGDTLYEARCGAGNGIIVRFTPEHVVRQVFLCEVAQRIAGGCRLTTVAAAPAA